MGFPRGVGGMLVVSLKGVNFRFWSRLGCSQQNTIIFSRKSLFKGCIRRNIKKLYIFNSFYLLDSCNQSIKWSLVGVIKRLGHGQIGLLWGFNSKFPTSIPTPFIRESPPRGVLSPVYLQDLFNFRSTMYNLRDSEIKLDLPKPCANYRKRSFGLSRTVLWNSSQLKEIGLSWTL